jgi:hypothetical protein
MRSESAEKASRRLPWLVTACLLLGACSSSSSAQQATSPVEASQRLATELGKQLDQNGVAATVAAAQNVALPWHAWDASSGRTSLALLGGPSMDVPMSFWTGTLWTMIRAAPSGDGYCLLVASGKFASSAPIAWWVKPSGVKAGKIADAAACTAVAPG